MVTFQSQWDMKGETPFSEKAIYKGLLKDDPTVLAYLYRELVPVIANDIVQNRGTHEEAKDHFQEVILVVSQNVKQGRYQSNNIKGYIRTIARNLWHKKLRKKGHEQPLDEQCENLPDEALTYEQYEELLAYDEQITAVEQGLKQLESPCQEVLTWHYFHQYPLQQIADHFNWRYAYAKKKIYECRKHLKSLIEKRL